MATSPENFPSCLQLHLSATFSERWRAKRQTYQDFHTTIKKVNNHFAPDSRLPDELISDWVATWVNDVFRGIIPTHNRLTKSELAGAVEDIRSLIEALRFVENCPIGHLHTCWIYELAFDPGMGTFPLFKEAQRHFPDSFSGQGFDQQTPGFTLKSKYTQQKFFGRASFLLNQPEKNLLLATPNGGIC